MRGSLTIGKIAKIPVRVHWSFSLLILLVVLGSQGAPASVVLSLLGWVAALFASVTIHELAHCFVARRKGLTVRDVVLLPIGGVSEIEGMPGSTPQTELQVAIVGPLTSLVLAGVLAGVTVLIGAHIWPPSLTTGAFVGRLAWVNALLAGFNLLPALPMDGGRVLRALLVTRRDPLRATRIATALAYVFGAAMIVVGLDVDWWLSLIGLFVVFGATAEQRAAVVRATFRGVRVGDLMVQEPVPVQSSLLVGQLSAWLASYPGRVMPVVDGENGPFVGLVSARQLVGAHPLSVVGDVCDRGVPVVDAASPLVPTAVELLVSSNRPELAVAWQGRVIGVLYRSTVEGALSRGAGGRVATGGSARARRAA